MVALESAFSLQRNTFRASTLPSLKNRKGSTYWVFKSLIINASTSGQCRLSYFTHQQSMLIVLFYMENGDEMFPMIEVEGGVTPID